MQPALVIVAVVAILTCNANPSSSLPTFFYTVSLSPFSSGLPISLPDTTTGITTALNGIQSISYIVSSAGAKFLAGLPIGSTGSISVDSLMTKINEIKSSWSFPNMDSTPFYALTTAITSSGTSALTNGVSLAQSVGNSGTTAASAPLPAPEPAPASATAGAYA